MLPWLMFLLVQGTGADDILIGGMFGPSGAANDGTHLAFQMAVDYVNDRSDLLPDHRLVYVPNSTSTLHATFDSIQNACYQIDEGVHVIIGPSTSDTVRATHPICAGIHIPHITPMATDPTLSVHPDDFPYLVKMSAPDWLQSRALADLVNYYSWTRFAIIASNSDYGRNGLTEFQQIATERNWVVGSVSYFHPAAELDKPFIRDVLKDIKTRGIRVVLLNCLAVYAVQVMEEASLLGMTSEGWAWVATDGVTSYEGLYNPCADVPLHLRGLIGTRPAHGKGALYRDFRRMWANYSAAGSGTGSGTGSGDSGCDGEEGSGTEEEGCEECDELVYTANSMRTFDAVLLAAHALHNFTQDGHTLGDPLGTAPGGEGRSPGVCHNSCAKPSEAGELLLEYIMAVDAPGGMNRISFTSERYPQHTMYEVVNLMDDGWKVLGDWESEREPQLKMYPSIRALFHGYTLSPPQDTEVNLVNVTLRVVSIEEEPFVYPTTERERERDNATRWKGYVMDLIEEIGRAHV